LLEIFLPSKVFIRTGQACPHSRSILERSNLYTFGKFSFSWVTFLLSASCTQPICSKSPSEANHDCQPREVHRTLYSDLFFFWIQSSLYRMPGFFDNLRDSWLGSTKTTKKAELPNYTEEEVAQHNTPGDIWIVVNGNVYDFTKWQYKHPGGRHRKFILSLSLQR